MKSTISILIFITLNIGLNSGAPPSLAEIKRKENPQYWQNLGLTEILSTLKAKPSRNVPAHSLLPAFLFPIDSTGSLRGTYSSFTNG